MDQKTRGLHAVECKKALLLADLNQIAEDHDAAWFYYELADKHAAACGAPMPLRGLAHAKERSWNREKAELYASLR
jgi:hypothetical protein